MTDEEKEAVETRGGRGGKAEQQVVVLTAVGTRGIKTTVATMEDAAAAAAISKLNFSCLGYVMWSATNPILCCLVLLPCDCLCCFTLFVFLLSFVIFFFS